MPALGWQADGSDEDPASDEASQRRLGAMIGKMQTLMREGKQREAIQVYTDGLKTEMRLLKKWPIELANGWAELVRTHEGNGDHEAALDAQQNGLTVLTRVLGEKHWQTRTAHFETLRFKRYVEADEKARALLAEIEQHIGEFNRHNSAMRMKEAAAAFGKALPKLIQFFGPESAQAGYFLCYHGVLLRVAERHVEAEEHFLRGLPILKATYGKGHPKVAEAEYGLAALYINWPDKMEGHWASKGSLARAKAEALFKSALATQVEKLGDTTATAQTAEGLALVFGHVDVRRQVEATRYLEQAAAIRLKVQGQSHPDTLMCRHYLSHALFTVGRSAEAINLHKQVSETVRQLPTSVQKVNLCCEIQDMAFTVGDLADYKRLASLALQTLTELKDPPAPLVFKARMMAADVDGNLGDDRSALTHVTHALDLAKETWGPAHEKAGRAHAALATVYEDLEDVDSALKHSRAAIEIFNKIGWDTVTKLKVVARVGWLYHEADQPDKAKHYLQGLAEEFEDDFGPDHVLSLAAGLGHGRLLIELGRHDEAIDRLSRSIRGFEKFYGKEHPMLGRLHPMLAAAYSGKGQWDDAKATLRKALRLNLRHLDLAASAQSERQQLASVKDARNVLDLWLSIAGQSDEAAASTFEQVFLWKGRVSAQQAGMRRMRAALAASGDEAAMADFAALEQVSRTLAGLALAGSVTDAPQGAANLSALTQRKEALEQRLAEKNDAFRAQLKAKRRSLDDVRAAIPDDAVLIDCIEYKRIRFPLGDEERDRHIAAFVFGKAGSITRVELGKAKDIQQAIDKWRGEIGSRSHGKASGEAVAKQVWSKLKPHLGDAKTVLISPDGALCRLPWAALPVGEDDRVLLEDLAVVVVPQARQLPELLAPVAGRQDEEQTLLVLGDVDYGADAGSADDGSRSAAERSTGKVFGTWSHLPATRSEMLSIADSFELRFEDGDVKKLRRSRATESALREAFPKHRFLHLATHGYFAEADVRSALNRRSRSGDAASVTSVERDVTGWHPGLLSGIVLAGANQTVKDGGDDAILTALEVAQMDLSRVELAVMSACETGLGETAGGEGLLGLQRAFHLAGARSVIAGLWKVEDTATQILMTDFYVNLWEKKMSRIEALRQAQLKMLREGAKRGVYREPTDKEGKRRTVPHAWAGFVLSGDWR